MPFPGTASRSRADRSAPGKGSASGRRDGSIETSGSRICSVLVACVASEEDAMIRAATVKTIPETAMIRGSPTAAHHVHCDALDVQFGYVQCQRRRRP